MHRGTPLDELHALVPAAEEIDLADEVDAERSRARFRRWFAAELVRLGLAPPGAEGGEEDGGGGDDDADHATGPTATTEPPLTDNQALGLLEHELGAEPLDPE